MISSSSSSSMELLYFVFLCIHIMCFKSASDEGDASDQNADGASDQNSSATTSTSTNDRPIENARIFSYGVLKKAANDFRQESKIGEGRFGPVYKGKLKTGQIVAVKMLNILGNQGDREFLYEVIILSLLRHPNIVNLIGFSAERVERLLVYEFMPLGSLDHYLHNLKRGTKPLDWETRVAIALGTARGLNYLHNEATPSVIFGDLKMSNILLDKNFRPRLSDFGLAKFSPIGDQTHVTTRLMASQGYCAPEYYATGRLTKECDVYAFGVVLLELITGRKHTDIIRAHPSLTLYDWFLPTQDWNKLDEVVDPALKGKYQRRSLGIAAYLALTCLDRNPSFRPVISDVLRQMMSAYLRQMQLHSDLALDKLFDSWDRSCNTLV